MSASEHYRSPERVAVIFTGGAEHCHARRMNDPGREAKGRGGHLLEGGEPQEGREK